MPGEANPCLKGLIIFFSQRDWFLTMEFQALQYVELSMS